MAGSSPIVISISDIVITSHISLQVDCSAGRQGHEASLCVRASSCWGGATGGQLTHGGPEAAVLGSDDPLQAVMAESEVILSGAE
ncbi:hypothetical protein CesoFtcFv8_022924 [Champsocephalus esox]|uniref:Uncharacterized protein n=1 Tax=Champsocephalus esox TaxID=159716 RepID=A0AAN8B767_9TELE|nr:hypothetical protein CesoFtcFv8_022924 [Champsocephalus esox]